jgi:hypothetical protein
MPCREKYSRHGIKVELDMKNSFTSFAGISALVAAVAGLLYSVAFIVLQNNLLSAIFLLLGGLSGIIAFTALYQQLRDHGTEFALLAFIFSIIGLIGSLIHGGYDLSNALHPPATLNLDLPNPVDPRGLLTFGVAGVGLLIFSWLMMKDIQFPPGLSLLGYASAILMIVLYVGRLIILQATNPVIVIPALLEGFLVNPGWYLWLGLTFLRKK